MKEKILEREKSKFYGGVVSSHLHRDVCTRESLWICGADRKRNKGVVHYGFICLGWSGIRHSLPSAMHLKSQIPSFFIK